MSVADITREIAQLGADEQFYVAAFLEHLANERDSDHASKLDAAQHRMDQGQKIRLEDVLVLHNALVQQGK
jgi:hypothetical protein